MRQTTLKTAALFVFALAELHAQGQDVGTTEPKPMKYVEVHIEEPKLALFQGFTLGVDILNPILYALGDYGHAEAQLRLNLRNTWLPAFEAGFGQCDKTDANSLIHYKTSAPFFRIGVDYNILKNKWQDNRLTVGMRYGLSTYNYDMSGPEVKDPIWGGAASFDNKGIHATSQWLEVVIGVQAKLIKNIHMGWTMRYKQELNTTKSIFAKPYYIPGYGNTVSSSAWGMTYSLFFDLNWGKKKRKIKAIIPQDNVGTAMADTLSANKDSVNITPIKKPVPSPTSKPKQENKQK